MGNRLTIMKSLLLSFIFICVSCSSTGIDNRTISYFPTDSDLYTWKRKSVRLILKREIPKSEFYKNNSSIKSISLAGYENLNDEEYLVCALIEHETYLDSINYITMETDSGEYSFNGKYYLSPQGIICNRGNYSIFIKRKNDGNTDFTKISGFMHDSIQIAENNQIRLPFESREIRYYKSDCEKVTSFHDYFKINVKFNETSVSIELKILNNNFETENYYSEILKLNTIFVIDYYKEYKSAVYNISSNEQYFLVSYNNYMYVFKNSGNIPSGRNTIKKINIELSKFQ
jgi:hypothetical protein